MSQGACVSQALAKDPETTKNCRAYCDRLSQAMPDYFEGLLYSGKIYQNCCCDMLKTKAVIVNGVEEEDAKYIHRLCSNECIKASESDKDILPLDVYQTGSRGEANKSVSCSCPTKLPQKVQDEVDQIKRQFFNVPTAEQETEVGPKNKGSEAGGKNEVEMNWLIWTLIIFGILVGLSVAIVIVKAVLF